MKYWRGYLTAFIFAAFTWALQRLGESLSTLVDRVYPYITRSLQTMLAQWSSGVDFCLWQVIAVVMIVLFLASIVLMIILRWNPIQWLGWVLAVVSIVYCGHTLIWGLNYYAGDLSDDIRMEVVDTTLTELEDATIYYRDKANALAKQMERDSNGDLVFDDFDTLASSAGDGFHALTYDRGFSVFAGSTLPVKELAWGDLYTSMGITGVTMALTGEAAVNPNIPAVSTPFTMCHEMAHRMCIATERDANFAAFLASSANSDLQFQYSAYFMAYRYCYNALSSVGASTTSLAAAKIEAGENEFLSHDKEYYNEYFRSRKSETATKVANTANDTYLTTSGDSAGIQSYAKVSDLLVSWYVQEVVLPAHADDEVERFDPTEVDLSVTLPTEGTSEDTSETAEGGE